MISDEAVEAAAAAVFANVEVIQTREYATEIARIAIQAAGRMFADAAPHEGIWMMTYTELERELAKAWNEGCAEGFARGDDPQRLEGYQPNPYRSQA